MREGGAMREEVLELLQKEKALEENGGVSSVTEGAPSPVEKIMNAAERRSENLLKHYRKLLEDEARITDPKEKLFLSEEKLSILREFNNLAAHILYTEMSEISSRDPKAGAIKSDIQNIYDGELAEITENANSQTDPGTLALIRTRTVELERMKIELEIRWIEKKMYDLHVDWSPEKDMLSRELEAAKEELGETIRGYVSALHDERNLLLNTREGAPERAGRLGYLNGRLVEFEGRIKRV